MSTLERDRIVFRFPEIAEDAEFALDFQRTLRIPDTERDYALPPGLGRFPLRHVEDYRNNLPAHTTDRGGLILPIWQAEAMWLNFLPGSEFPVAIKVAAGKINAVTGEPWMASLNRGPQDYMVAPDQPWLDGFAIEKGVIRQFVAMPLGDGYSVEEQLTGEADWGGLQISVTPLKKEVWERENLLDRSVAYSMEPSACLSPSLEMGMGAGGRMRQSIERDRRQLEDWDQRATQRVFVTLLHAKDWKSITGEAAPNHPPTAHEYSNAGLPWFEWYGADQALDGSDTLSGVKSVGELHQQVTGANLPHSEDVDTGQPVKLGPGKHLNQSVSNGDWE